MNNEEMVNTKILCLVNCYKNEQEVINYCNMIYSLPDCEKIDVVININALSKDVELQAFHGEIHKITNNIYIYNSNKNLGYLNGMLYGYGRYCEERNNALESLKWVIMSNTDIKIVNMNFVELLLMHNRYSDDVACIAPQIRRLNPKGFEKHYQVRYKRSKLIILYIVNTIKVFSDIYSFLASRRKIIEVNEDNQPKHIYEAHGSFFIIRYSIMSLLMAKKWPFLMYNEEAYISDLVFKTKHTEYYDPLLKIEHTGSTTTCFLPSKQKRKMLKLSYRFLLDIYSKNYWEDNTSVKTAK